jgi:hypothetical protein
LTPICRRSSRLSLYAQHRKPFRCPSEVAITSLPVRIAFYWRIQFWEYSIIDCAPSLFLWVARAHIAGIVPYIVRFSNPQERGAVWDKLAGFGAYGPLNPLTQQKVVNGSLFGPFAPVLA